MPGFSMLSAILERLDTPEAQERLDRTHRKERMLIARDAVASYRQAKDDLGEALARAIKEATRAADAVAPYGTDAWEEAFAEAWL